MTELEILSLAQDDLVLALNLLVEDFKAAHPTATLSGIMYEQNWNPDGTTTDSFKCTVSEKVNNATITRSI